VKKARFGANLCVVLSVVVGTFVAGVDQGMALGPSADSPPVMAATAVRVGTIDIRALPPVGRPGGVGSTPSAISSGRRLSVGEPGQAESHSSSLLPRIPPTVTVGTKLSKALDSADDSVGVRPSDTALAVGGGYVVQMVNRVGRIWTGTTPGPVFSLSDFFIGSIKLKEPWLLFDQPTGKFMVSVFDLHRKEVYFGASKTSDPTGKWTLWSTEGLRGGCADQVKLGVNDDVVALAWNELTDCSPTGTFLGAVIEVFSKSQINGNSLNGHGISLPTFSSLVPAQSMTSNTTELFAGFDRGSGAKLRLISSTGDPADSTQHFTELPSIPVRPYADPPDARQPGTTVKLNSGDGRIQHAAWRSDILTLSATDKCTPAGDTKARACARIIAVDTKTSTVVKDVDISKKRHYYVYPAIGLNAQNQIIVTFGDCSGTTFPRLMASAASLTGSFAAPVVVKSGTQPNATGRYGDYFALAIDPAEPANAWVAGDVGGPLPPGAFNWNTAVVQVLVS
jgi:hypothetical protein